MEFSINTKVAGTTSGPTAAQRQQSLEWMAENGLRPMVLLPEPTNPHDPDAIKVMIVTPKEALFHLGYVKNSDTICRECGDTFERFPSGACPTCRRMGRLERCGSASRLTALLRERPDRPLYVEPEITGGTDGKGYGCNLTIHG